MVQVTIKPQLRLILVLYSGKKNSIRLPGAVYLLQVVKAQTIAPMHIGYGRTVHSDNPLPILSIGAIQTTGDARSSFSADVSIETIPGVNSQALLAPAGSQTDITNRENQKGSGVQLIYNRGSSGNLSGPAWRRDWIYDGEQYKYKSGTGHRDTGDYQMWSLEQSGNSNTATDHLVMVQGTAAARNGALQFNTAGNPGTGATPDYTQINNPDYNLIRAKADWTFDLTGETAGGFDVEGSGLTRGIGVRVRAKWNDAATRFDGLAVQYDAAGTFAANSKAFVVQQFTGVEQFVLGADGNSRLGTTTGKIGFYNSTGSVKRTVAGSRAGNAALNSLIDALSVLGLITDTTTA